MKKKKRKNSDIACPFCGCIRYETTYCSIVEDVARTIYECKHYGGLWDNEGYRVPPTLHQSGVALGDALSDLFHVALGRHTRMFIPILNWTTKRVQSYINFHQNRETY